MLNTKIKKKLERSEYVSFSLSLSHSLFLVNPKSLIDMTVKFGKTHVDCYCFQMHHHIHIHPLLYKNFIFTLNALYINIKPF